MEVGIGRHLIIGLDTTNVACSSIHGNLRHALLLVLMQPVRSQFVYLFRRHVGIGSLDLTLDVADSWHHSAGERIRLSHSRRGSGNPLRTAIVKRRALHSATSLESRHHSRIVWCAIDIGHVEIWRVRTLGAKLLLIVKLRIRLRLRLLVRLLLSVLQYTLLLLKTIRLANDSCIVR